MRTNIVLDDELVREASRLTGIRTKRSLVDEALRLLVKTKKRRAIRTPKLYFFDCGLPNTLLRRILSDRTPEYGQSFEQFCVLEALAAQHYDKTFGQARYFRSASGYEVDLVLDDHTGIEFKTGRVHESDTRGLIALSEDVKLKRRWVVCTESQPRTLANGVEGVPWQLYCAALANGLRLD